MSVNDVIKSFWKDLISSNKDGLMNYFTNDAILNIHNVDKEMTAKEYIDINCRHKEKWSGEIVRIVSVSGLSVSVVKIDSLVKNTSYNVVSFMAFTGDKISKIDEYWAENGQMPMWN